MLIISQKEQAILVKKTCNIYLFFVSITEKKIIKICSKLKQNTIYTFYQIYNFERDKSFSQVYINIEVNKIFLSVNYLTLTNVVFISNFILIGQANRVLIRKCFLCKSPYTYIICIYTYYIVYIIPGGNGYIPMWLCVQYCSQTFRIKTYDRQRFETFLM